jgi:hypothetical protein
MVRLFILVIEQLFLPNAGLVQGYIATECSQAPAWCVSDLGHTFLDLIAPRCGLTSRFHADLGTAAINAACGTNFNE